MIKSATMKQAIEVPSVSAKIPTVLHNTVGI